MGRRLSWVQVGVGAIAVLAGPSAVAQVSGKQRNALNHMAQVSAAAAVCEDLRSNDGLVSLMLVTYGIDLAKPAIAKQAEELAREHIAGIRAVGPQIGCRVAYALYGPAGENVPGLLRRQRQ